MDTGQAVGWFRKAAEQGDTSAAFNLGVMYANGTGVPADPVEAYRWLSIVAARASGDEQTRGANALKVVAAALSPAQLDDARARAGSWMDEHKR